MTQETCEHATSVVCAPTASAMSRNGTARTVAPRARAATSGPISPGCSLSEVTISSPGPSSSPAITVPRPSLVEVFSARSATSHPSTVAYSARSSPWAASRASKCGRCRPCGELRLERVTGGADRRHRHRAVGSRVQERVAFEDGELGAEGGGVHAAADPSGRRPARVTRPPARRGSRRGGPARPRRPGRGCRFRRPRPTSRV